MGDETLSGVQPHGPRPGVDPWRVFLSHTSDLRDDRSGRSYVAAAEAAVIRSGHAVTDMAYFVARDVAPSDYCSAEVARADVYVGIIGHRYGSTVRGRPDISYTELEFEAATRSRIPRLLFLIRDDAGPLADDADEHGPRQAAFRARLLNDAAVIVAWVSSPAELEVALVHALGELMAHGGARVAPPEPRAGLPPDPVEHFVGREPELAALRQRLTRGRRLAICGLGGVGKTQLAARHAWEQRDAYRDGVFWLVADQEASLVGDLASLSWRLGLPEREDREQGRRIEGVTRWLREHEHWLLVLDNVEPAAEGPMRRWLPPGLRGAVLATSRTSIWSRRIALRPLPLDVARRFLLQRTGQQDVAAATRVAESLSGLPLALEQAAAYMEVTGRELQSYASLLRERLLDLMLEAPPEDYPSSVASTWMLSFERLGAERPAAIALLRLCAHLAADDIPVSFLLAGAGEAPPVLRAALSDPVEFDRTIAALARYSLIERHADQLRMHRLVQAIVRESLGDADRRSWLSTAVRLLRTAVISRQPEDPTQWTAYERLQNQLEAIGQSVGIPAAEPAVMSWLLHRLGVYLRARGQFAESRRSLEHALHVRERVSGRAHPDTAETLTELAWLMVLLQGTRGEARPLVERALVIREHTLGADHPDTATSLLMMATVLGGYREYDAAQRMLERGLAIRSRTLGLDHPDTAEALNNLGALRRHRGDSEGARPLFELALSIRERTLGPDHQVTAQGYNNLASVLRDLGELDRASVLYVKSLAICQRVLGPHHSDTARCLHNLGVVLWRRGEPAAAASLIELALPVFERTLDAGHRWIAESQQVLQQLRSESSELRDRLQ